MMQGEISGYDIVKRFVRKDGAIVWGHLTISMSRDASGQPALIISSAEDVTARKRAEEERDRLVKELEESVRVRDVFLSVAAHELRTPLTPLQLDLQLFQRKREMDNSPMPIELARAMRQTARLTLLIDSLLDITRIREGRLAIARESVDLAATVRSLVDRYAPEADAAGCALASGGDREAWAKVDPVRIEQVVGNLIANAIKFGARKPVDVSAVTVGEGIGAHVRLSVRDHGIGLEQGDQARVFGRFERAVSDMHYGGLGLGLYIAAEIVQAHHGHIRVESTPGSGAEFIVELPVET
jgi:signal transduction histidine kinase